MFVMLICCVSAASATDVDNITVPDDTGIIEIDDTVDSVEEVENEGIIEDAEASDDSIASAGQTRGTVTPTNYQNYFDSTTGYITTSDSNLIFSGNFDNIGFKTFRINRAVSMDATGATFNNMAFDLQTSDITLNGGTFTWNSITPFNSVITIKGSNTTVNGATISVTALNNTDCYAFDLQNANHATLSNNIITYVDTYANPTNYNYAVKIKGGSYNKMVGNNITAFMPLKDVDYTNYTTRFPSIDLDLVAGVAVESSSNFNFTGNKLNVTGNLRAGYYPTLDALLIVKSDNVNVIGNQIYERDSVSKKDDTNYLYAVDIYRCNNIKICSNKIELNSNGGNLTVNGTGAAYGIQLTGPHTGVLICNNNITTANNGPNLGIYSQNTQGATNLTIYGNRINVTGKAGNNPWALVSGMELQDTYATVYGNIIRVNNTAGYHAGYCAYGISYSQSTPLNHYYNIHDNNVTVYNGDYAVFLIDNDFVTGKVINNTLIAYKDSGNNAGDNAVNPLDPFNVDVLNNH
jgi:hypothetical protein